MDVFTSGNYTQLIPFIFAVEIRDLIPVFGMEAGWFLETRLNVIISPARSDMDSQGRPTFFYHPIPI
jgi:hypothetical protein